MDSEIDRKLSAQALLAQRVEHDRLMLDDAVLQAAIDGTRRLSAAESAALQGSPLSLRRFRHLAMAGRRAAAKDLLWQGSHGMLRAASDKGALQELSTDDGFWSLHFVAGEGWQVILKLAAQAPFAAQLLAQGPLLRVSDGEGATVLQGRLDADGECECSWPFAQEPGRHFQERGALFSVAPAS